MAEALANDVDAFLAARAAAREQFNAQIAAPLGKKQQLLDIYTQACKVADADPSNGATWAAAAAARVTYLAALDAVNAAIADASAKRDAAIVAAAQTLDKAIAATGKK